MPGKMQWQSLYTVVSYVCIFISGVLSSMPSGIFAVGTHRIIYLLGCQQWVGNGVADTQICRISCTFAVSVLSLCS